MAPWWQERFANPSSRLHRPGLEASAAVEHARGQVGQALGMAEETVTRFWSAKLDATPNPNLPLLLLLLLLLLLVGVLPPQRPLPSLRRRQRRVRVRTPRAQRFWM